MEKKTEGFYHTVTINLNDEKFRKKLEEDKKKLLESGRPAFVYLDGQEWKIKSLTVSDWKKHPSEVVVTFII